MAITSVIHWDVMDIRAITTVAIMHNGRIANQHGRHHSRLAVKRRLAEGAPVFAYSLVKGPKH